VNIFVNIILAVQMLAAVGMIGLILVQHGKGADMGAAFGSGSSGSLFGASGSANFLSRTTAVLAAVFFVCTLGLTYFGSMHLEGSDAAKTIPGFAAPAVVPEAPASSAPVPASLPAAPGSAAVQTPASAAPAAASAPAVAKPAASSAAAK
jgi:preprotein translocase subunit SecG